MSERVNGNAERGDIVAYEDMANPRREYVVLGQRPDGEYRLMSHVDEVDHYSDLRQHGWTFVREAE